MMAKVTITFPQYTAGQRVQFHPATDRWMRGARYGTVERQIKGSMVRVRVDATGRTVSVHPENLIAVE